jgi:hypothetical protein
VRKKCWSLTSTKGETDKSYRSLKYVRGPKGVVLSDQTRLWLYLVTSDRDKLRASLHSSSSLPSYVANFPLRIFNGWTMARMERDFPRHEVASLPLILCQTYRFSVLAPSPFSDTFSNCSWMVMITQVRNGFSVFQFSVELWRVCPWSVVTMKQTPVVLAPQLRLRMTIRYWKARVSISAIGQAPTRLNYISSPSKVRTINRNPLQYFLMRWAQMGIVGSGG